MRIIGGIYGGRVLHPPKGLPVRPTTDFAKTGLFNILTNQLDFENTRVLDLFSGTGNITFEFVSRGARSVVSVDKHPGCVKYSMDAAREMGMTQVNIIRADVFKFIKNCEEKFDLAFADPPYAASFLEEVYKSVFARQILSPGGLFILEHGSKTDFSGKPFFMEKRTYGNVNFSIFIQPPE